MDISGIHLEMNTVMAIVFIGVIVVRAIFSTSISRISKYSAPKSLHTEGLKKEYKKINRYIESIKSQIKIRKEKGLVESPEFVSILEHLKGEREKLVQMALARGLRLDK